MSVYTHVSPQQLEEFLTHYNIGQLVAYQGISSGIENTNYFVTTTLGEFVLTLFEQHEAEDLPFFLELMAYLAEHGIPSAHPLPDEHNRYLTTLNHRPTAIVQRLQGRDVKIPTLEQCWAVGYTLGQFHTISPYFPYYRANDRGPNWWFKTAKRVSPFLSDEDAFLLKKELIYQSTHRYLNLPKGVIHADLFRDNALFEGNQLTGVIDFYYACNDVLLFDLATTVNDWCSLADGQLHEERLIELLDGYQSYRVLNDLERRAWPAMLRAAALRFWLSRLQDKYFPRVGQITHIKNPDEYRNILLARLHTSALEPLPLSQAV